MKILKYIFVTALSVITFGCSNDPIDQRLSKSDYFVAFNTKNGTVNSLSTYEGLATIVTVDVGAPKGSAVTVDFEVILPTVANPISAAYKLYDMAGNEITTNQLTFPEGTGSQKFQFLPLGNEILDPSRVFTIKLKSNSAGYTIGIGRNGEASSLPITVQNVIPIKIDELVGEWDVSEELYYSSKWNVESYTLNMIKVNNNTLNIVGITGDGETTITATVELEEIVKTIHIPGQKIEPTWSSSYDTYFSAYGAEVFPGGFVLKLEKTDNGTITINFGASYGYEIAAATPGTKNRLGMFITSYATKFVKKP